MSTTTLFAEILVIGMQALVWVSGFLVAFRPYWHKQIWSMIVKSDILLAGLAVATVYTIGILVDRIADDVFKLFREEVKTKQKFSVMRLEVMGEEGRAAFLEYQRHRLRIARATVLNVALTLVAGIVLLARAYGATCPWPAACYFYGKVLVMVLAVMLALTWYVAKGVDRAQSGRLVEAYDISKGANK